MAASGLVPDEAISGMLSMMGTESSTKDHTDLTEDKKEGMAELASTLKQLDRLGKVTTLADIKDMQAEARRSLARMYPDLIPVSQVETVKDQQEILNHLREHYSAGNLRAGAALNLALSVGFTGKNSTTDPEARAESVKIIRELRAAGFMPPQLASMLISTTSSAPAQVTKFENQINTLTQEARVYEDYRNLESLFSQEDFDAYSDDERENKMSQIVGRMQLQRLSTIAENTEQRHRGLSLFMSFFKQRKAYEALKKLNQKCESYRTQRTELARTHQTKKLNALENTENSNEGIQKKLAGLYLANISSEKLRFRQKARDLVALILKYRDFDLPLIDAGKTSTATPMIDPAAIILSKRIESTESSESPSLPAAASLEDLSHYFSLNAAEQKEERTRLQQLIGYRDSKINELADSELLEDLLEFSAKIQHLGSAQEAQLIRKALHFFSPLFVKQFLQQCNGKSRILSRNLIQEFSDLNPEILTGDEETEVQAPVDAELEEDAELDNVLDTDTSRSSEESEALASVRISGFDPRVLDLSSQEVLLDFKFNRNEKRKLENGSALNRLCSDLNQKLHTTRFRFSFTSLGFMIQDLEASRHPTLRSLSFRSGHRKHSATYDGLNPKFFNGLRGIFDRAGLTE